VAIRFRAFSLAGIGACVLAASAHAAAPPAVGALVPVAAPGHCYEQPDDLQNCTPWPGLQNVVSIAVTPDGRWAFVASGGDGVGQILVAQRNPASGALTPQTAPAGCYSSVAMSPGGLNCTVATDAGAGAGKGGSYEQEGLAISPDGRFLYAVSPALAPTLGAIVAFSIDPTSGALTQLPLAQGGCVEGGTPVDGCKGATALTNPDSLTLSPDGQTLYATSYDSTDLTDTSSITAFHVNTETGGLTQLAGTAGCVTSTGNAGACVTDSVLEQPGPIVVSPDGLTLHVANVDGSSIETFSVESGGVLDPVGCVDPNGGSPCTSLQPFDGPYGIAGSPDGRELYVAYYTDSVLDALATPSVAAPTVIGCAQEEAPAFPCTQGAGVYNISDLAAAPDGQAVYGAAGEGNPSTMSGVVAFARNSSSGALTQYPGGAGCQTRPPATGAEAACATDQLLQGPYAIAVSPDSNFVYAGGFTVNTLNTGWLAAYVAVAAPSCQNASVSVTAGQSVALPLTCGDFDGNPITIGATSGPAHGALGAIDQVHRTVAYTPAASYRGADSLAFAASDGTNSSAPANVAITVTAPPVTPPGGTPKPAVNSFTESATAWSESNALPATISRKHKPPVGTKFGYTLSEAATVSLVFTQTVSGRRVHKKCVAPTKRNRRAHSCQRTLTRGTLSFAGHAGLNRVRFAGRLSHSRKLKPGRYTVTITARNRAGASRTRSLKFTIVHP
jgi:6-phosphogluconolactonase (cycloisomerase 2 family)